MSGWMSASRRSVPTSSASKTDVALRAVKEERLPGEVPRYEVPGWREKYGLIAGITGRPFDLGLWSSQPVGEVMGRWRQFRATESCLVACALGHKACRDNRSVLYHRLPRLFDALLLARGDGRYSRLLKTLARVELLILDDWGLAPLTPEQGRDLLEVLDDRHGRSSTIVTSQLPVEHWHELIGNPTIADAILDRLVHNAHRLILKGDSMRKLAAKQSGLDANPPA